MQSLTNVSPIAQIARVSLYFLFLFCSCFGVQRNFFFFSSFLHSDTVRQLTMDNVRGAEWKRRECLRREWRKKSRIPSTTLSPPPSAFSCETLFFNTHTSKSRLCFDPFDTT